MFPESWPGTANRALPRQGDMATQVRPGEPTSSRAPPQSSPDDDPEPHVEPDNSAATLEVAAIAPRSPKDSTAPVSPLGAKLAEAIRVSGKLAGHSELSHQGGALPFNWHDERVANGPLPVRCKAEPGAGGQLGYRTSA